MDDDVRRQIFYSRYKDGIEHAVNLVSDDFNKMEAAKAYFGNLANLLPESPLAGFLRYLAHPLTPAERMATELNRKCYIAYQVAQQILWSQGRWDAMLQGDVTQSVGWRVGEIRYLLSESPTDEDLKHILSKSRLMLEMFHKQIFEGLGSEEQEWLCVIFVSGLHDMDKGILRRLA